MKNVITRFSAIGVLVGVLLLTLTSLSSVGGGELHGVTLLAHMIASGLFVVVLPVFAIAWMLPMLGDTRYSTLTRFGYWGMLATGLATIATMFFSMLPLADTATLRQLIWLHGYAGFATVVTASLFACGWFRSRTKAMR